MPQNDPFPSNPETPDDIATFRREIEQRFGSDKALGVYLEDETGARYTLEEGEQIWRELGDKGPDTTSYFPDGTYAVVCTNYAAQILYALPDRTQIMGFANVDNPTSRVAKEEIHPGGHDFAVIDGRWLVDPWIRLVASEGDQICFDLHDEKDAAIVLRDYGPQSCWSRLPEAEDEAKLYLEKQKPGVKNTDTLSP